MGEEKQLIDLKTRTRNFALRIIKLYSAMPKSSVAQVIGKQMLRSGTSVGAHYREGMRARSNAEFISKLEGGRRFVGASGGRPCDMRATAGRPYIWMGAIHESPPSISPRSGRRFVAKGETLVKDWAIIQTNP